MQNARCNHQDTSKENMEEQIKTMLENVLKEEIEDCATEDKTLFSELVFSEKDDLPSFMNEENNRRNKKAFSSKPNLMKSEISERSYNNFIQEEGADSPMRAGRKARTYAHNNGVMINNMQKDQGFPEVDEGFLFEEDEIFEMQRQMTGMNINGFFGVQSNHRGYYNHPFANYNKQNILSGMSGMPGLECNYFNKQNKLNNKSPTFTNNLSLSTSQEIEEFTEKLLRGHDKIDEEIYFNMKGIFLKIIKTQNGSRYLQKTLKKTSKDILSKILIEILPHIQDLIIDSYANYFCQKLFIALKGEDRIKLLKQIAPYMVDISKNKIGTYPLQAFIEQLMNMQEKKVILEGLGEHIYDLCFDCQGVHIVEKIIVCFEEELIMFIYDLILKNFMVLANNCNGLCAVKKAIIHCTNPEIQSKLLKKIVDNCMNLVQNPFGNYAIQVAVDHWKDEHIAPIIKLFKNKFGNLSMQKYSSNVIEKCLERGGNVINSFIEEVTTNHRVTDLMKNNYGNYVVQRALKLSSGSNKMKLITCIVKYIEKIGDKKLILKWKSIIEYHLNEGNIPTPGSNSMMSTGNDNSSFNFYNNKQINNSNDDNSPVLFMKNIKQGQNMCNLSNMINFSNMSNMSNMSCNSPYSPYSPFSPININYFNDFTNVSQNFNNFSNYQANFNTPQMNKVSRKEMRSHTTQNSFSNNLSSDYGMYPGNHIDFTCANNNFTNNQMNNQMNSFYVNSTNLCQNDFSNNFSSLSNQNTQHKRTNKKARSNGNKHY